VETGEIRETIRSFIGGFIRARNFKDSDNIFEAGFINSLFVMQLILFVEKKFSLAVEDTDLNIANFSSVDALSSFVSGKLVNGSSRLH
jgi:methoxymalonate biosynthesis acyl carrier protein